MLKKESQKEGKKKDWEIQVKSNEDIISSGVIFVLKQRYMNSHISLAS